MTMVTSNYSKYFESRRISAESYSDYKLPAYFSIILGDDKRVSILDFGSGFGQNLSAIKNLGYENICGYEIEPDAIESCANNHLAVIDGRNVSIDRINRKFDLIIMTHVLEHLHKDSVISTLKALYELLNDSGRLLVSVPNAQSNTGCYWMYEDFTHQTLFTSGSLYFVLRQAGFSDVLLVDRDCLMGLRWIKKIIRKTLLFVYRTNNSFWNKVTDSSYHAPSPVVNSYEVKMIARK